MKRQDSVSIIKASGERAVFSPDKLRRSLIRSGASTEQVQTILKKIESWLFTRGVCLSSK